MLIITEKQRSSFLNTAILVISRNQQTMDFGCNAETIARCCGLSSPAQASFAAATLPAVLLLYIMLSYLLLIVGCLILIVKNGLCCLMIA